MNMFGFLKNTINPQPTDDTCAAVLELATHHHAIDSWACVDTYDFYTALITDLTTFEKYTLDPETISLGISRALANTDIPIEDRAIIEEAGLCNNKHFRHTFVISSRFPEVFIVSSTFPTASRTVDNDDNDSSAKSFTQLSKITPSDT